METDTRIETLVPASSLLHGRLGTSTYLPTLDALLAWMSSREHPEQKRLVLIHCSTRKVFWTTTRSSGVFTNCGFAPARQRVLVADDHYLGCRRDLNGILFANTILESPLAGPQESVSVSPSAPVGIELTPGEARLLIQALSSLTTMTMAVTALLELLVTQLDEYDRGNIMVRARPSTEVGTGGDRVLSVLLKSASISYALILTSVHPPSSDVEHSTPI